jgi:Domain of unknown function (DUF5668)
MQNYVPNRFCQCARCRLCGVMGPAILITLGVLILLSQTGVAEFNRTWPVILIVIGAIKILQSSASTESHVSRYPLQGPPQGPPTGGPSQQGPQNNSGQVQNV